MGFPKAAASDMGSSGCRKRYGLSFRAFTESPYLEKLPYKTSPQRSIFSAQLLVVAEGRSEALEISVAGGRHSELDMWGLPRNSGSPMLCCFDINCISSGKFDSFFIRPTTRIPSFHRRTIRNPAWEQ